MPTTITDSWRLFWAKTDRDRKDGDGYDPGWTRPLWAHLLDVGHTALLLWERTLPDTIRRSASVTLDMTEEEAGVWLSFWIGLHDLGKAIPSFQFQQPDAEYLKRIQKQGFALRPGPSFDPKTAGFHHGHATTAILYREQQKPDGPPGFKESLAAFVGFHHGRLAHASTWREVAEFGPIIGDTNWRYAQGQLLRGVYQAWDEHYGLARPATNLPDTPPWLLGLAGWATLADWLGSYAPAFDREVGTDLGAYLVRSRAGADRALREAGFGGGSSICSMPFSELFPELAAYSPRPIQQALLDLELPIDPTTPTLTIVEAPTGEGKTEAALALAARQQERIDHGGGLYLALPTQATANGLMSRATAFLEQAHQGELASFQLAYGRSELHSASEALIGSPEELATLYDEQEASEQATRVRILRWFLGRKRALLAPYGLGTVDQALLGILYARHFFLRLYGLCGKTVVVDEVHAYDTYTNVLLERLLSWLRALGAHVILLSATLPAASRRALLKAWDTRITVPHADGDAAVAYPLVWTVADGILRCGADASVDLSASRRQVCTLERGDPSPEAVAKRVADAAMEGAVVAVVCNTVQRSQEVFRVIDSKLCHSLKEEDLALFHARFVRRDRQRIETWVLERFGKHREAGPAVLVGTQVIEQSLDLDVDLMISDIAPIDLLLQRAGRLHRHSRTRPKGYREPRFVWLCHSWESGLLPDVREASGHGKVYDQTVLWRTALELRDRDEWNLPEDYRPLIEAVYHDRDITDGLTKGASEQWEKASTEENEATVASRRNAARRIIPVPEDLSDMLELGQPSLADDDDESAHASVRAFTREGDSVEAVVLHANDDGELFLDLLCTEVAPMDASSRELPRTAVRALLGASVRLGQPDFIRHLRERERPQSELWQRAARATPSLNGLHLIIMQNGIWSEARRALNWDDRLGLVVSTS